MDDNVLAKLDKGHSRADFIAAAGQLWTARTVLATVGIACGYVAAAFYRDDLARLAAFLIGFGVVHLPASVILLVKGLRGEGPS